MIFLVCFEYLMQSVLLHHKLLYNKSLIAGNKSYDQPGTWSLEYQ
jgi:hypothetical protein